MFKLIISANFKFIITWLLHFSHVTKKMKKPTTISKTISKAICHREERGIIFTHLEIIMWCLNIITLCLVTGRVKNIESEPAFLWISFNVSMVSIPHWFMTRGWFFWFKFGFGLAVHLICYFQHHYYVKPTLSWEKSKLLYLVNGW